MKQLNKTILVCEDNFDSCELLRFVFKTEGYEVTFCDNLEECLVQTDRNSFHALILDNRIGSLSSVETCSQIKKKHPGLPIIFYSGEARQAEIEKALKAGANAYLIKPLDFENLVQIVSGLIKKNL